MSARTREVPLGLEAQPPGQPLAGEAEQGPLGHGWRETAEFHFTYLFLLYLKGKERNKETHRQTHTGSERDRDRGREGGRAPICWFTPRTPTQLGPKRLQPATPTQISHVGQGPEQLGETCCLPGCTSAGNRTGK